MTGLQPYAVCSENSRGRIYPDTPSEYRNDFQRDRDRIIHSAAFRRLEYKTQVFVNHEGDMFRTRLTHSIEVAQISRTIARNLGLNEELTEAISLAHDLGHTPFGHAGQTALHRCMRRFGGFEHNLQSLRVVDTLEESYPAFPGLNLTFETREGILKHCSIANARRLDGVGERFIKRQQPSLEAQVANLADEIAYNNHDVDDGLRAGLLRVEDLLALDQFRTPYEDVIAAWPKLKQRRIVHEVIRRTINHQVVDLISASAAQIAKFAPATIDDVRQAPRRLIGFSAAAQKQHQQLKRFLVGNFYHHYRVHRMSKKAEHTLEALFKTFFADHGTLPEEERDRVAGQPNATAKARVIADYIAGMTDRYAILEHERVFNPTHLT